MATANKTFFPAPEAQKALIEYAKSCIHADGMRDTLRSMYMERDREYYREQDRTEEQRRAKVANRNGDSKKMQNPVVPVVAPQVETSLAYFTETFLSSYPIFPVVAKPQLQGAALAIETLLGESAIHFQWAAEFAKAMRDGLKYNLLAVEVEWKKDKVYAVENRPAESMSLGIPVETVFEGNKIRRLDPYNLILDRRVAPDEVHKKGDFAGYVEMMTRMQLKQLLADLDSTQTMNATKAFQSSTKNDLYYVPEIVSSALTETRGVNWMRWAELEGQAVRIDYKDMYEVVTLYVRIIPKEMKLSVERNHGLPQIFKMVLVNGSELIYLERKTNAHNFLPVVCSQLVSDGHGYQTKSLAESSAPYQQIATSLWASAIASQRKKVYDRIFYDPSAINKKDIDNTDPVARIPIKTEAYGRPLSEAIYTPQYRDDTVPTVLQMAQQVVDMGNVSFGQNRVSQGQFQKGNKTRFEVEQVQAGADSRPKMYATLLETTWFQPIKHILKSNILQYQPPAELYNRDVKQPVRVAPEELRKTIWQFKVADGILPADKLVDMEGLNYAMQLAMAQPAIAAEYDILGMYFYQMQLRGASWIQDFKRTPEQRQEIINQTAQSNGQPTTAATPAV